MIALLQRVSTACVVVKGETVGTINKGLLVFVGVERHDTEVQVERLLQRILGYRVFPDDTGRMNLSVREALGGLLLVSQFTLVADTTKGMRPSFTPAASPADGQRLFNSLVTKARERHDVVATGQFGADMQVSLTNDGPVSFVLRVPAHRVTIN